MYIHVWSLYYYTCILAHVVAMEIKECDVDDRSQSSCFHDCSCVWAYPICHPQKMAMKFINWRCVNCKLTHACIVNGDHNHIS